MKRFDVKIDRSDILEAEKVQLSEVAYDDQLTVLSGTCNPEVTVVKDGICTVSFGSLDDYSTTANCDTQIVKRMGYITIDDTKYYIEDGSVEYDGNSFPATYIKNDAGTKFEKMYVLISGDSYDITDGQADKWYNIQKVNIHSNDPMTLYVDDCTSIGYISAVTINDKYYQINTDDEGLYHIWFQNEDITATKDGDDAVFDREDLGLTGNYQIYSVENESEDGEFLRIHTDTFIGNSNIGDVVRIQDLHGQEEMFIVKYDEDDEPYIEYSGLKYPISADMAVMAVIDGSEYEVEFDEQLTPDMKVGHIIGFSNVYVSAFTSNGLIDSMYKRTLVHNGNDTYFSNEVLDYNSYSGIMFNDCRKIVYDHLQYKDDEVSVDYSYVMLPYKYDKLFQISEKNADSGLLRLNPLYDEYLNPSFNGDSEDFDLGYVARRYRQMTFTTYINIFGYLMPNGSMVNVPDITAGVFLEPYVHTVNFNIPLGNARAINLNVEQQQADLLDERLWSAVNGDTDLERDIYSPVYYKYKKNADGSIATDDEGVAIIENTVLLNKLKFNLHFRTRNLDDWSVNEDNVELDNDGKCSWNCLDHYFNECIEDSLNSTITYDNDKRAKYADGIANGGDLLYFLNFTNQDVFYQKSALAKTFIRLSFFDSPKPNTQNLLWTSTVFFDEGACYFKYLNNIENYKYRDFDNLYAQQVNTVSVKGEPVDENGRLTFNSDDRLAMEFEIENKTKTRVSSEGYYIYIYKDYAQYLHERTIYMRVDFNHAKVGQSVPMMMLRHVGEDGEEMKYQASNSNDVFKARDGVKMEDMLNYLYIPVKIVYNEDLGRYTYHFENVVPAEEEGDMLSINLFECKYKDESR